MRRFLNSKVGLVVSALFFVCSMATVAVATSGAFEGKPIASVLWEFTGALPTSGVKAGSVAVNNSGTVQQWSGSAWANFAPGGAPSGTAGGDLGGTYPNPTVVSVAHVTTGTLAVANGGTGAVTAGAALTSLGAAASGANADITALNGITSTSNKGTCTLGAGRTCTVGSITGSTMCLAIDTTAAAANCSCSIGGGSISVSCSGGVNLDSVTYFAL